MPSIKKLLENPYKAVFILDKLKISKLIPDKSYLKMKYRAHTGKKLNLKEPKRFNEKLQWLKLYNHNPEYTKMVDKCDAKKYVAEKLGNEYIIPTYGVWNDVEDIDFDMLPEQFVLKCTHDSGGLVICKDKSCLDIEEAKEKLKKGLETNFYFLGREWPYKNVKPRIIAEKYMEDDAGDELTDYKVLCCDGIPRLVQVHKGRFVYHTQDYYDLEWNELPIIQGCPPSRTSTSKPEFLDEMIKISGILAEGIPQVRVDWYYVQGQLYFGELTFFDSSGFDEFIPDEYNEIVGSWITLSTKKGEDK